MGSDLRLLGHKTGRRRFNSRSRMGSDGALLAVCAGVAAVSIHAPAWGATRPRRSASCAPQVSIHAPAWGATRSLAWKDKTVWFQFTLPHGERQLSDVVPPRVPGFNSRSRMGSDASALDSRPSKQVSIHAPAWGATEARMATAYQDAVSIHAPAWGAT